MTLTEIVTSSKETLTPADVAEVLGCDPYNISVQVREGQAEWRELVSVPNDTHRDKNENTTQSIFKSNGS